VKALLELYPDAKFIYLMRNPYTVFESTRNFFLNTIKPLELHSISVEQMEENILHIYQDLYTAYRSQKHYIPRNNLFEVRFEDIEFDALGITRQIYQQLRIPGWEEARPAIEQYISSKKSYKKNKYAYEPRTIELVNKYWGDILDEWGYEQHQA